MKWLREGHRSPKRDNAWANKIEEMTKELQLYRAAKQKLCYDCKIDMANALKEKFDG